MIFRRQHYDTPHPFSYVIEEKGQRHPATHYEFQVRASLSFLVAFVLSQFRSIHPSINPYRPIPTMCKATEETTTKAQEQPSDGSLKFFQIAASVLGVCAGVLLIATVSLAIDRRETDATNQVLTQLATSGPPSGDNPCAGKKPDLPNVNCVIDEILKTGEQSGANVTLGYKGSRETDAVPITTPYYMNSMCPVNVHWHLGAEHYSAGQFDETGTGPSDVNKRRQLAGETRQGFQCKHFDADDEKFTKKYDWQHCKDMEVGQTYEVHWPHSAGMLLLV